MCVFRRSQAKEPSGAWSLCRILRKRHESPAPVYSAVGKTADVLEGRWGGFLEDLGKEDRPKPFNI